MAEQGTTLRDVAALKVGRTGRVEETGDPVLPFRVLDEHGVEVDAVGEFLHHMLADDASPASLRSYAYELLAWFRFLRAIDVPWHAAGRTEAQDLALWLKISKKPPRQRRPNAPVAGSVNPVTGKATSGENYAARTRRHARAVIRRSTSTTERCTVGRWSTHSPRDGAMRVTISTLTTIRCSRSGRRHGERCISPRNPSRRRGASPIRRSMTCSRPCPATEIGRCSRSTSRPVLARRSCSVFGRGWLFRESR